MASFDLASNPASRSCRLVDFDKAEVRPGFVSGTFILIVSGTTPCINMKVSLNPVTYVRCPDYWKIEVVGCLPQGICLPAIGNYNESLPLSGITGSKGIEVVGAKKKKRFEVSGGCQKSKSR